MTIILIIITINRYVPCAIHVCINSNNSPNNPVKYKLLLFYFTDEISETEKSSATFFKVTHWRIVEIEYEPQKPCFGLHALKYDAILPLLFVSVTN